MRVLAVASYGVLGGGELSLAEFLVHRPAHVEAAVLLIEDGPLRGHLTERGLRTWVAAGHRGRPGPRSAVRFTRSLLHLLDTYAPDVIWATGLKAAALAVPAGRLSGIPVVWHKIDFSLDDTLTRPLAFAVDGVVSVSHAVAEAMGPLRARRLIDVIGPPVRLPLELHVTPSSSPLAIGTLATLTPIKGQRHVIEAAALLLDEFPELRVILAGSPSREHPDYPQELRDTAARLGIADRVELSGFATDVAAVLRRLTVFVNATHQVAGGFGKEGLSGAMLEASWAGLPVVATRGGGTPEGVRDGSTGTLVEPEDVTGMAAAIAPYLRDPALAAATGERGSAYTRERFAPRAASERLFAALATTQSTPR